MMPKNADGLIKPKMLGHGDTIAVISPSWGCAGVPRVRWQYRLGERGFLQQIKGVIIGKMCSKQSFEPYAERLREVVSVKYGLTDMPILYGLNFGHASPICVLPYGAEAELDADALKFTILESGVVS